MHQGIDVHTHIIPEHFPKYAGTTKDLPWPSMAHDGCGHANVMISGKNFRTVADSAWDTGKRCKDMDAMHIHRQVLSPMPELLSYWLPAEDARVLLRYINEQIAGMVASDPNRFSGLGAVPLQDVDMAIRELEHAVKVLGLSGVEIAPNVNGIPVGDPRFEPFFDAAEKMGAAIFMHALRPAGKDRLVGPPVLEQIVAFPCEVALGIASLMTGGILERHANVRLACSHGGGAFAMVLARMQGTWKNVEPLRQAMPQEPKVYAQRLYYDTCVFDPQVLRFLMQSFGEKQLIIGTDYPFGIYERDPVGMMERAGLTAQQIELLTSGNAKRFLGLP